MQPYAVPSYAADKAVSSSPQLRPEPQSLAVPSPKSPKGKGYCGRWSPVRDHAESSAPLHSSNSLSASMKRQPPPLSPGAVGPGSWLEGLVGFADTNTEDWSMDQVCHWLKTKGFGDYKRNFWNAGVDGRSLLHLTKDDLRKELGIAILQDRKDIWEALEALRAGRGADSPRDDRPKPRMGRGEDVIHIWQRENPPPEPRRRGSIGSLASPASQRTLASPASGGVSPGRFGSELPPVRDGRRGSRPEIDSAAVNAYLNNFNDKCALAAPVRSMVWEWHWDILTFSYASPGRLRRLHRWRQLYTATSAA
uniref:SAM domain-containing protein n=1 Tax=Eutreptiella gymnastica TaxID=73025 RepID=A0A7S4CD97_9EUGL